MLIPGEIISVNAPTIEDYQADRMEWSGYPIGIIYSIHLSNGMVVTSPERFEQFKEPKQESPQAEPRKSGER